MDFHITQDFNGPGNVTVVIKGDFSEEEAGAITEAGAWAKTCLNALSAPRWCDLVNPGIRVENCVPVYADHFQSIFPGRYGFQIQQNLSPMLQSYRANKARQLEVQRNLYLTGEELVPPATPFLPKKKT